MAVDNLNYYSSGLPAGQQTDKYTSQPGCLKSKNLDIFSSSKSVKATAWSEPSAGASDIIKQDGDLILKTDGKVYDISSGTEVLVVDPSTNFPSYKVSYNGKNGTYSAATWGTVKDMVVAYEGDEWKSFVVYTDRSSYTYSKVPYIEEKSFDLIYLEYDTNSPYSGSGYVFHKTDTSHANAYITIDIPKGHFANVPIRVKAAQSNSSDTDITLDSIIRNKCKYYYDPEIEQIVTHNVLDEQASLPVPAGDIKDGWVDITIPEMPTYFGHSIDMKFVFTKKAGASTFGWSGDLCVYVNLPEEPNYRVTGHEDGDFNEYYSYLPIDANRKFVDIGEYYWLPAQSYQTLYKWESSWAEVANREKKTRYDLVQYMGWANDPGMDVVSMIAWNESIYMIGNLNGNGYIIPCDLSGGRGTPFIAYGCTFKGATNIDYLLYLVGEDRGISTLWVFNQQELVPLLGGNRESGTDDLVDPDEEYNFDGKIINYRKNLILTTSDGRIFRYGQTYGGKGGTFIHDLDPLSHDSLTIDSVRAYGNDLIVNYTVVDAIEGSPVTTHWTITYQDDIAEKNYNTEWMAEYPIQLGNHLLEKEESDLYASYILPCSSTKLEFWGMANHYHFWTFKSDDNPQLNTSTQYKLKDINGSYYLQYVEKNGKRWTFRLVGDLPSLTEIGGLGLGGGGGGGLGSFIPGVAGAGQYQIVNGNGDICLTYNEYNHFRKIGEITTTEYQEGEFRFHNLNNKLELPKTHSLQIMVKGIGTKNYTPELFALDLVANQRDRG